MRNDDVYHVTEQPPRSCVVKLQRFSLFEHVARMFEKADVNQILCVNTGAMKKTPGAEGGGRMRSTCLNNITADINTLVWRC